MTLWKGRFKKPMSSAMERIGQSLATDLRLFPYEIEVDRVYSIALLKAGVIDKIELQKLHSALHEMLSEYECGEYTDKYHDEDVHSLIERVLTAKAGDVGGKIHTGRSRNDLVLTDTRLYLRDKCQLLKRRIINLGLNILGHADKHMDTVLSGYTHMQRAQPVSLAHYLYSFCFYLRDDIERLDAVLDGQLSILPLGSGAIAGSGFPIDRNLLARDLGFERISENSIQTVSSRDDFLELGNVLAMIMIHLSRYAEDFIIWSTNEFNFVEMDDSVTTGSSMMPQKKNPDSLELIRGKAARVIGGLQTLFTLQKGLPLTYSRDLQEDKPALFDMMDNVEICLDTFADVFLTIDFNIDSMKKSLSVDLIATDLADYLVKKGVPFRKAHEVVADIFKSLVSTETLTIDNLKTASKFFDDDAEKMLSPEKSIELRNIYGGTGPESLKKQSAILNGYFSTN